MLRTRERIITIQDLIQEVHTAIASAQREPLVVSENGRPAAYLVSVDLFDALIAQLGAQEEDGTVAKFSQISASTFTRGI